MYKDARRSRTLTREIHFTLYLFFGNKSLFLTMKTITRPFLIIKLQQNYSQEKYKNNGFSNGYGLYKKWHGNIVNVFYLKITVTDRFWYPSQHPAQSPSIQLSAKVIHRTTFPTRWCSCWISGQIQLLSYQEIKYESLSAGWIRIWSMCTSSFSGRTCSVNPMVGQEYSSAGSPTQQFTEYGFTSADPLTT
jgi:hypothetical protein